MTTGHSLPIRQFKCWILIRRIHSFAFYSYYLFVHNGLEFNFSLYPQSTIYLYYIQMLTICTILPLCELFAGARNKTRNHVAVPGIMSSQKYKGIWPILPRTPFSEAPLSSWLVGPERLLIKANDIMNILNGEYLAFGCKGGGIGNNIKRHRGTSFSACSPLCLFGIITVLVFHRAAIGSKNSLSTSMYYSHPT